MYWLSYPILKLEGLIEALLHGLFGKDRNQKGRGAP